MYTFLFKLWFLTLGILGGDAEKRLRFQTAFKWNYINFTYPSSSELYKSAFEPGTNTIFGIDIYKPTNSIFLTLPRTHRKARVTLARLSLSAEKENPLLSPFPSWEMNRGNSCFKLQDVSNIEIDTEGIMWVLDAKRNNKDVTTCPARIALFNLKSGGRFFGNFIIPEEFCSWSTNCLVNDIVLDGNFVYLAYVSNKLPGIMVLNKMTGKFWRVKKTEILTENVSQHSEFKRYFWIALSPPGRNRSLYIAPQQEQFFFKIPTKVLQNEKLSSNGGAFLQKDVKKFVDTTAVVSDSEGDVYFGYPKNHSVFVRDATTTRVHLVDRNPEIIDNIGTFAFDNSGYMYMTSARSDLFDENPKINIHKTNFRILKVRTGTKSYQHPNLLKQSAGHRHLHVEDLVHEKESLKKHQDELKRHIEDHKRRLQQEEQRIKNMEKLQKDEQKRERDDENRKHKEEQERRRNEEKHKKEEERRRAKEEQDRRKSEERHQKEKENRRREEERRRAKEEQEKRRNEERHQKEIEHRRQENERRRQKEEQQRLKDEEKHRQEEEKRHREEDKINEEKEKRRQQRIKDEENRRREELKRQHEEAKRKQKEEEQRQLEEQKRLEEEIQKRLKHLHEGHQRHNPHNQEVFTKPIEYSTRHQTVRRTRPQYPTTTEYSTSHHTVRRTRPEYPTTTNEYPTSHHTVRRTRPEYPTTTTEYPTSHHTVRRTRPTTPYFTVKRTKPHYPTTTEYSTSHHTIRRTRPPYTHTTEYLTTRRRTPPHYTQSTVNSTSHHQGTRPHYTTESPSTHHETKPHYT